MDFVFLIVSTLCFLGGFCYSVAVIRSGKHRISGLNMAVMGLGFAFQCIVLYHLGQARGECPTTNVFDILIFVSWSMVLLYFLLGPPFRVSLLGMFTAPVAFLFQTVALLLPASMKAGEKADPTTIDPWGETHAAISLIAYGAFALAFVAGVMFLVQDHQLKKRRLKTMFYNLPPIHLLGKSIFRLLALGFVLLTAGIGSAFLMKEKPDLLHLGMALAVWAIYGVIVVIQAIRGSGAKRMALNAIWAFVVPLVTLWVISHD